MVKASRERVPAADGQDPVDFEAVLNRYMAAKGLKASRQRSVIVEVFFASNGHMNVNELLEKVHREDPRISTATVYRTMKLLTECGLAHAQDFGDGQTRYETAQGDHHDHLICTSCGTIVEFENEKIEQLQQSVARQHGFTVSHHKMELYGSCPRCSGAR